MASTKEGYKQVNFSFPLATVELLERNRRIVGMTKSKYIDFLIRAADFDKDIARHVLEKQVSEILECFDERK